MFEREGFRGYLDRLRSHDQLLDLHEPVDSRHIATLVDQSDKALLFHRVIGYDMPVGENGRMLSGGQRQSVAVARALLLNPQIMVFDEPTSSMDNSTEAAFKQRLGAIARGKTIILVTHRHSMLALVDRLIVLDRGKVVADGPKSGVLEALMGGRVQARE